MLTSFINFYDIFVWQIASKKIQMEFVAKLLMQDCKERLIMEISRVIDLICSKINIDHFNKALSNFNEVIKKLMFGDDYEYSDRKEYFITRKALLESLEANEECISVFINIFYASWLCVYLSCKIVYQVIDAGQSIWKIWLLMKGIMKGSKTVTYYNSFIILSF